MPKSLEFYDLEYLLSEVDSKKHEQVIEMIENAFYSIDYSDEEATEIAKSIEKLRIRTDEIIGVTLETSNLVGDNPLAQLRDQEVMKASMGLTKLINSAEEIQKLVCDCFANILDEDYDDNEDGDDNEEAYDENNSGLNKLFGWLDLIQGNILAESEYISKGVDFEDTGSLEVQMKIILKN